jgi:signal transduction histidine kinase
MKRQLRPWLAAPGLALAAGASLVVLEGPNSARVLNAMLAGIGVLLVWSVAVAVRVRYPERRLSSLLFALATVFSLQAFAASPNPWLFTLARAARPAVELLLVWTMLAFPSGRLQGRTERGLVLAGALSVLLLWLPGVMFSPGIPIAGPFVQCGTECPRNLLFVADRPDLSQALLMAFRAVGTSIVLATVAVLAHRLRAASPLSRRMLAPVLLAAMARALTVAVFLVVGGVTTLLSALTFWAVPLAIALGLLRGRLYTARVLQHLVSGLRSRPGAQQLRDVIAKALDDPSLRLAYWVPRAEHWVGSDGQELAIGQAQGHGQAVRIVADARNRPVAALLHDEALLEEPVLLDAIAGSMQAALESQRVDAELLHARANAASAAEHERRRIERDLHDGAQQRLLALRMKLGVTRRLFDHDPRRAVSLLDELDGDVQAALVELRSLSHGIVPPLLAERGLAAALLEVASRAAIPTCTQVQEVGRVDPAIERAVYFCCLEALQNAAKHAGAGARATIVLRAEGEELEFGVADDGTGLTGVASTAGSHGLANLHERMAAVGGQMRLEAIAGGGTRVSGRVGRVLAQDDDRHA